MDSINITAVTATTSITTNEKKSLDRHIQGLCQELQDMIFECVQDSQRPFATLITKAYRSPTALQINRKSRAEFAKKYYGNTIFVYDISGHADLTAWIEGKHCYTDWVRQLEGDARRAVRLTRSSPSFWVVRVEGGRIWDGPGTTPSS